jgi:hypothetical protein
LSQSSALVILGDLTVEVVLLLPAHEAQRSACPSVQITVREGETGKMDNRWKEYRAYLRCFAFLAHLPRRWWAECLKIRAFLRQR